VKAGWKSVSLADLVCLERRPVSVLAGDDYPEIGVYCFGKGIFHKRPRSGLEVGDKALCQLRSGDLILQITFAWEGAVALCGPEEDGLYASTRYPTFRVDEKQCDPKFLCRYLSTPSGREQLVRISPGSAGRNRVLSLKRLGEVHITLPPLTEQRAIVARIEALSAEISEAKRLRQEAVVEAGKLLFAACQRSLRDAENRFASKPLISMCDPARGISYGIVLTGSDTLDGVPTLRAGDLQWHRCRTAGIKRVAAEAERSYTRTRLQGGELLLRIRGGVGAVAVCPAEMRGGNVSREIAVIPFGCDIDSRFAMYLLSASDSQDRMSKSVKGTSYVGLNLKDVRELHIPIPPLPEQRRMVAELDAIQEQVDSLKRLQSETAAELDALLPAILDRAFKGELD
jgi:type I restriction enzyme S subunit